MIYIVDNFLDKEILTGVSNYLNDGEFNKEISGGKNFYIKTLYSYII